MPQRSLRIDDVGRHERSNRVDVETSGGDEIPISDNNEDDDIRDVLCRWVEGKFSEYPNLLSVACVASVRMIQALQDEWFQPSINPIITAMGCMRICLKFCDDSMHNMPLNTTDKVNWFEREATILMSFNWKILQYFSDPEEYTPEVGCIPLPIKPCQPHTEKLPRTDLVRPQMLQHRVVHTQEARLSPVHSPRSLSPIPSSSPPPPSRFHPTSPMLLSPVAPLRPRPQHAPDLQIDDLRFRWLDAVLEQDDTRTAINRSHDHAPASPYSRSISSTSAPVLWHCRFGALKNAMSTIDRLSRVDLQPNKPRYSHSVSRTDITPKIDVKVFLSRR